MRGSCLRSSLAILSSSCSEWMLLLIPPIRRYNKLCNSALFVLWYYHCMDVIFDWNLGYMIYNGLITLWCCGFPFVEIRVILVYMIHTVQRMAIDFPKTFDFPAPRNLQEWSDHKIPRGFFGTHLAPLWSASLVLHSAVTSLPDPRIHLLKPPRVSSFHGEVPEGYGCWDC